MSHDKGQILGYTFPEKEDSSVIKGFHRIVVLHSRGTPYNTVLIAPITSAEGLISQDKIPSNYVELKSKDYPFILDHDSFINLDMTIVVDECELNSLNKNNIRITSMLSDFDLCMLDYKIYLTYELNKFFKTQMSKELENIVIYIDKDIKVKIESILTKVKDPELMNDIISVIDDLVKELRKNYINNEKK